MDEDLKKTKNITFLDKITKTNKWSRYFSKISLSRKCLNGERVIEVLKRSEHYNTYH